MTVLMAIQQLLESGSLLRPSSRLFGTWKTLWVHFYEHSSRRTFAGYNLVSAAGYHLFLCCSCSIVVRLVF